MMPKGQVLRTSRRAGDWRISGPVRASNRGLAGRVLPEPGAEEEWLQGVSPKKKQELTEAGVLGGAE
jgi:hypothetical protein